MGERVRSDLERGPIVDCRALLTGTPLPRDPVAREVELRCRLYSASILPKVPREPQAPEKDTGETK